MSARLGSRGSDVPPSTWEIPAAAAATWLLVAALLLPVGRGAVAWAIGGGWVWPTGGEGQALLASIGGLATGDPTAGLTTAQAAALPGGASTYAVIAVAEVLLVAATFVAVRIWWQTLGPGSMHGMASRGDVAAVLGLTRLRTAGPIIRPDLYPPRRPSGPLPTGTPPGPMLRGSDPARGRAVLPTVTAPHGGPS